MSQQRTEMNQLQELVRLHRMGTACREVARLLAISPNTERQYREILAAEGLLSGAADALPELAELKAAVVKHVGEKRPPPQISSVERWRETVQAMMTKDAMSGVNYSCRLTTTILAGCCPVGSSRFSARFSRFSVASGLCSWPPSAVCLRGFWYSINRSWRA